MALARAYAVGLVGLDGQVVEVEADLAQGLPGLTVIGLPDAALAEARDRVRAAVVNSGQVWPGNRITLALSPASLPKRGSGFDLALAASVLAASGAVPAQALLGRVLLGELGLDGRVRAVPGVLPAVLTAARAGIDRVVVPLANLAEARLLPGVSARGVGSLRDLVALLTGEDYDETLPPAPAAVQDDRPALDLLDVAGQVDGRTAVEVAAAGGHHLLLLGPPGSGKTMLAERMPALLPALLLDEALEVTAVHSVAGTLPGDQPLVSRPPFQDPHHTATVSSIVGGGSGVARPGAASLAHRGVLFLDKAASPSTTQPLGPPATGKNRRTTGKTATAGSQDRGGRRARPARSTAPGRTATRTPSYPSATPRWLARAGDPQGRHVEATPSGADPRGVATQRPHRRGMEVTHSRSHARSDDAEEPTATLVARSLCRRPPS